MHTLIFSVDQTHAANLRRTSYTDTGTVIMTNMPATNQAASHTQQQGHDTRQGSDVSKDMLRGLMSLPVHVCMLLLK
jgi:hypothetical protein